MTKEKKIEAIYKEMADKELTFGCKLQTELGRTVSIVEETTDERGYIVVSPESLYGDDDIGAYYIGLRVNGLEAIEEIDIAEIIGHPVMIGDVMQYLENKSQSPVIEHEDDEYEDGFYSREDYYDDIAEISDCWSDKRLSIDEQPDECIDYVYSLIQKD